MDNADKPRTIAVIKAGILPSGIIEELRRWGLPLDWVDEYDTQDVNTPEQVVALIEEALSSVELVELRDTDLDIIHRYITSQKKGRLQIYDSDTGEKGNFTVYYCVTNTGDYVIPWRTESMVELITDPSSHLKTEEGDRIKFADVRELFFGGHKAFMVAVPREVQTDAST